MPRDRACLSVALAGLLAGLLTATGCSGSPRGSSGSTTGGAPSCGATPAGTLYPAECTPPQTTRFCFLPRNIGL